MNMGGGSEVGADFCTYNEGEKIVFTSIPVRESSEYIWVKKYFNKPLGAQGGTQEYRQAREIIYLLCCDKERNLS